MNFWSFFVILCNMKFCRVRINKCDNESIWMLHLDSDEARDFAKQLAKSQFDKALKTPNFLERSDAPFLVSAYNKLEFTIDMGRRESWYVNKNGGMCPKVEIIHETREADAFPVDEVYANITQWPNGTHYYARLNNGLDVEWNGQGKWDTFEEAQKAAELFIDSLEKN